MDENFDLKSLVDSDMLQGMQKVIYQLTGMAVQCTDENGVGITENGTFTEFCANHIQSSAVGRELCEQCVRYSTQQAKNLNKAVSYICHCGLIDITAPIVVNDKIVGAFVGGQVLLRPLREAYVKEDARELGIDPDMLWEAAGKIPVYTHEQIDAAVQYIEAQAKILSEVVYGRYLAGQASKQIENTDNAKSDFLANMSHEIRTPMNAVIGMAEMALREDMTSAARDYIGQIKNSGKALLNIINDILDFSKIESGKMELTCVDYEPLSLINDVSLIIMTRLTEKPVELLLDVDPDIPHTLVGDDLRIRQILINLANNATKFTQQGHVLLRVRFNKIDNETVSLIISVVDTGIGIKREDIDKLFSSFQQVDSKRNRNVEGTGLGLAITRNLVTLMEGQIHVESEYEVGSTFTVEIPQKIADANPSIRLKNPEKYALAGFFSRADVAEDFKSDAKKLNVYADDLSSADDPEESISAWLKLHDSQQTYIVVDEKMLESTFAEFFKQHTDLSAGTVLLAESFSDVKQWSYLPQLQIIKKPFSVLNLASFLDSDACKFGMNGNAGADLDFNFIAPDAKILIVDDNEINLSVAEGLLEPLKMQVDTASSGKQALEKLADKKYDIIFMDHMMPEMDGIETTRIIRRLHPEYDKVPIIALTANAVSGTKEMFLAEGMNDFVAKPIEVRILINKVHSWLSEDKKVQVSEADKAAAAEKKSGIPEEIGDLDVKAAFALLGSEKLFFKVFKDYYRVIEKKADIIDKYYAEQDWKNYVVEVHALKSASKQIGAMELSAVAAELEAAGNAGNIELIREKTADMLAKYRSYSAVLEPFCREEESNAEKAVISEDILKGLFDKMLEAVDNLDMEEMSNVIEEMDAYSFEADKADKFMKLKEAVADIDVDECEKIVNGWFE